MNMMMKEKEMADPKEVSSETDMWLDDLERQKAERMKRCQGVMKMSGILGMHWGRRKEDSSNDKTKEKKIVKKPGRADLDAQRRKEDLNFYKNFNNMI